MAICPFMSQPLFDMNGAFCGMHHVDCIQTQCEIWDSKNNCCGVYLTPQQKETPSAASLINEFKCSQDLDENGLIYGKDFTIREDESEKPSVLSTIEQDPDWEEPSKSCAWSEYLDWKKNGTPIPWEE